MHRVKLLFGALLAALACAAAYPGTALAQTPAAAAGDLQAQYDAAFQEMLKQPANLDVLFKFATLASKTGDLEGAISALERMLLIDPNLPRVRLELGVLYYRLGSYEVARTYLDAALKTPNMPPDVRERAQKFMAEIQSREKPSHFSGELFMGWRYQSNANLGPTTSTVRLFGQAANLNASSVGAPDWGTVTSAQIRHTYDLGRQDKSAIETQLVAYANRQFQATTANVILLDFTTGPRFQVFNGTFEDVTLKPFATLGEIWVNDTPYYGAYGAGLEAAALLTDRLRNVSTFVFRRQNHPDTWYLPTNSTFRGTEYTATTTFQYALSNLVTLFSTFSSSRFETDVTPAQSYQLWGAGGGFSFRFTDPAFKTGLPWSITLGYSYQWWTYDQPDATVDPNTYRLQLDSILNLVFSIPFDDRTTFSLSGGRFVRTSTLPNYEFENDNVMFGVSWRF
ncbi:MAG TPA: tetratricopeptide repeat protein [Reyranella sp.]|nr:tetratricopeptide repeat protein [Reyranella sp.]